jgi:two-component system, chemotaxis family, sensor kinase CheA
VTYEEDMAAALSGFVVEARELLQEMETSLLQMECDDDPELVAALFRAAHTIKGSSGLFGLDHVVQFTHTVESALEQLRSGSIAVTPELVGALLPCRDHIAAMVDAVADGVVTATDATVATGGKLLERLAPLLAGAEPTCPDPAAGPAQTRSEELDADGGTRPLHLSVRFGPDCLRSGMDPLAFIRYLSTLGTIPALLTLDGALPEATQLDPEICYLGFQLVLITASPMDSVVGVFDFVREESDIRVLEAPDVAGFAELVRSYETDSGRVASFLIEHGAIDASTLAAALTDGGAVGEASPAGDPEHGPGAAVEHAPEPEAGSSATGPPSPQPALAAVPAQPRRPPSVQADGRAAEVHARESSESRSIRVEAPRLDRLIDVVGELVIAGAAVGLRANQAGNDALLEAISDVMRLVEEVRDSALQLRMVPIGTTFSRFQRVVRDVSAELGKDISLSVTGGETEVDKALVERIGDPLMHLVRNSMDHGIESAEVRLERGKPARGSLRLNAFHDSGSIVIEVQDDGGGISRDRVLAKAIERGLVDPGASLTDGEIYNLIFEPGFSTAETVSNLSGRGVGMDVVKRNVTTLRGTIDVESRPGLGSTVRIRLPLTLAIIDGFLVGVGGSAFVIPLDRVVECVALPQLSHARDCMDLRGEVLPFLRLRSVFSIPGDRPRRENVVVVDYAGVKTGLVVDTLMGEFQTVIKPLGQLFEHVQGIGGATILGDGEVALIIDVPVLVRHHADRQAGHDGSAGFAPGFPAAAMARVASAPGAELVAADPE